MLIRHKQAEATIAIVTALKQSQLSPIIDYCKVNFPNLTTSSTDHHAIFALAIRNTLNEQLEKEAFSDASTIADIVRSFVQFALAGSFHTIHSGGPTVFDPSLALLVLEDAFDSTPISACSSLWQIIEDDRDAFSIIVNRHQRFRMPLLRICTSLMRRLSRSQHAILVGRILICLAYMFPLTDRSGVNLQGLFNVDNVTEYDDNKIDLTLYDAAAAVKGALPNDIPPPDAKLASVLPSIGCLPRLPAIVTACKEALMDVEQGTYASSPAFYRTFWRLQMFVNIPAKALITNEAWAFFVCTARIVLRAFDREDQTSGFPTLSVVLQPQQQSSVHTTTTTTTTTNISTGPASNVLNSRSTMGGGVEEGEEADVSRTSRQSASGSTLMSKTSMPLASPTSIGKNRPSVSTTTSTINPPSLPLASPIRPLFTPAEIGAPPNLTFEPAPGLLSSISLPNSIHAVRSNIHQNNTVSVQEPLTKAPTTAITSLLSPPPPSLSSISKTQHNRVDDVKYLTSPNLLKLELRDTAVRRHVLVQLLIALQYLTSTKMEYDAYTNASTAVTLAQAAAKGHNPNPTAVATLNAAQATLTATKKPKETIGAGSTLLSDALFLHNMAFHLLRRTSPDGTAFAQAVAVALQRELFWRSWKAASAPDFERTIPIPTKESLLLAEAMRKEALEKVQQEDTSSKKFTKGNKRSRAMLSGSSLGGTSKRPLGWASKGLEKGFKSAWDIAADSKRAPHPSAADYAAPMRIALDPSQGIDREYYPSNDKAFVWRAYRTFATEYLSSLADVATQNFETTLGKLFPDCVPPQKKEEKNETMETADPNDIVMSEKQTTPTSLVVENAETLLQDSTSTINASEADVPSKDIVDVHTKVEVSTEEITTPNPITSENLNTIT